MSKRTKLEKFAENQRLENVFENFSYEDPTLFVNVLQKVDYKGKWKSDYFKNAKPLVLELACGRGEYSIGLAQMYPNQNYIGVDVKGARIWTGAKRAIDLEFSQVAFIRSKIETLPHFFAAEEVDQIWIIFSDPFLRKENRRLTSIYYLDSYLKYTHLQTSFYLKTDDDTLYEFSLKTIADHPNYEIVQCSNNIYAEALQHPALEIKTYYEKMHLQKNKTIKYIEFKRVK